MLSPDILPTEETVSDLTEALAVAEAPDEIVRRNARANMVAGLDRPELALTIALSALARRDEDIPIAARLMALADVFDALISPRIYKPPMDFADASGIILAGRGSHFDPEVTDAFLDTFEEFREIATRYHDNELDSPT